MDEIKTTQQKQAEERKAAEVTSLLIWKVPKELKVRFKASCARKRQTMKEAFLDFMSRYCD